MKKALAILMVAMFVLGFAGTAFARTIPRLPVNDPLPASIDQISAVSPILDPIYPQHPLPKIVEHLRLLDSILFPPDEG